MIKWKQATRKINDSVHHAGAPVTHEKIVSQVGRVLVEVRGNTEQFGTTSIITDDEGRTQFTYRDHRGKQVIEWVQASCLQVVEKREAVA